MIDQLKNWQTTLAGFVAGFILALVQYYNAGGKVTWQAVLSLAAATLMGFVSKDASKTGTTEAPRGGQ